MLENVLDEAKQLPGVTTRAEHLCSEQEERLDQKSKKSVVQQTMFLIEAVKQHREFQNIICRKNLTNKATLPMLEQADATSTSTLVDGNHTKEVIARTEPGEMRKIKKEE